MSEKKVYIIGIGGAGTSALAMLYKKNGYEVSGSDDGDGFYHDRLSVEGIEVFKDFRSDHITEVYDFFVHSTAFDDTNIEVQACKHEGFDIMSYPEAIGKLTEEFHTVAVCGTHGKTTTTGYAVNAFIGAGRDVSAIIGAPVIGWDSGARVGTGKELILEADEYQNKLAHYDPQAVILTSVDYDHPDFFPDDESYKQVFRDFIVRIPQAGFLIAHYPDLEKLKIKNDLQCNIITYGEDQSSDAILQSCTVTENEQKVFFSYNNEVISFTTILPGKHNARNALAAWLMAYSVTKDGDGAAKGLADYKGVARRFERQKSINGAICIDDYAHHPEEIRTTLATVKELYPKKKLIAAFHPHTFTRTKELLNDFARTLNIADEVIVLDIYGSAREVHGGVHATDLVEAINKGGIKKALYTKEIEELAIYTKDTLTKNDVFITLGAGDIYKVHDMCKV